MYLGEAAFTAQIDRTAARDLFREAVRRVEVETHSYCNRRCGYCPNVIGDRLGPNKRMPPEIWNRILADLGEIGYDRKLVLNNYNEPLADTDIVQRIAEARDRLPEARILIYTNGDYLDPDYVERLARAGLSYMHISVHMNPADIYDDTYALRRIEEISRRIGLPAEIKAHRPNEFIAAEVPHPAIEIEIRSINYWKLGNNRGELITEIRAPVRTLPCHFPFAHFYVGFEGDIVPCCHIKGDRPEHKDYRIGALRDYGSIFEAFAGRTAVEWRRHLISFQPKSGPCSTCTAALYSTRLKDLTAMRRAFVRHVAPKKAGRGVGDPA